MSLAEKSFSLNNGLTIPAIGYGTYLMSNDEAEAAVNRAIELGYRHIDTAAGYQNEAGVGAAITASLAQNGLQRKDVFVTTKLWPGNPAWGDPAKGYQETISAFEHSLSLLGLDYVDLYLIHAPFGGDKRLEQWEALVELQSQGKSRSIGVSNYTEAHLDEIVGAGLPLPQANQLELHPWTQKPALVQYLREKSIVPIAYSSLAPLSTWRTEEGQDSAKSAAMKAEGREGESQFAPFAHKYGVSEAQLLLRWGLQNAYPVLPRSLNPQRMQQNLDLYSFSIDEEDMTELATFDRGGGIAWAPGDPTLAA